MLLKVGPSKTENPPASTGSPYAASPFVYKRFPSRSVRVGKITIGGDAPIRIQSMTTTDTMDTRATLAQAMALFDAGAELVRITAPGPRDAENLKHIKNELQRRGYDLPLVADIHFSPKAALIALEHVEKVRINPGNFADRKRFQVREYTDTQYQEELEHLRKVFLPLVRRARELGRTLRIGSNHGSLSDRIMNRYGDTPLGMVESALEFIRFAKTEDYHDIIVSMKSSNPQIMVQAYRLLVERFYQEGHDCPLHLGVTEAGSGRDGRMKSAIGIGALLLDGIGDTIRVSLTEDPIEEIPAARRILEAVFEQKKHTESRHFTEALAAKTRAYEHQVSYYQHRRVLTKPVSLGKIQIGGRHPHRIFIGIAPQDSADQDEFLKDQWYIQTEELQKRGCDVLWYYGQPPPSFIRSAHSLNLPWIQELASLVDCTPAQLSTQAAGISLSLGPFDLSQPTITATRLKQLCRYLTEQKQGLILNIIPEEKSLEHTLAFLKTSSALRHSDLQLTLSVTDSTHSVSQQTDLFAAYRLLLASRLQIHENESLPPLLLRSRYSSLAAALYPAAAHLGALLLDGIGDSLFIEIEGAAPQEQLQFQLDILQAARLRFSKTEYISCPSCGRTLFDLEETTHRIQKRTRHLKGLKIAVMGCIVNGPGEMADADFGYVGAGPGKVHLYREKELVKANVPTISADEELVQLIRKSGRWKEP